MLLFKYVIFYVRTYSITNERFSFTGSYYEMHVFSNNMYLRSGLELGYIIWGAGEASLILPHCYIYISFVSFNLPILFLGKMLSVYFLMTPFFIQYSN